MGLCLNAGSRPLIGLGGGATKLTLADRSTRLQGAHSKVQRIHSGVVDTDASIACHPRPAYF